MKTHIAVVSVMNDASVIVALCIAVLMDLSPFEELSAGTRV